MRAARRLTITVTLEGLLWALAGMAVAILWFATGPL